MEIDTNPQSARRGNHGPNDETEGGVGGLDMFNSLNEETEEDRASKKDRCFVTALTMEEPAHGME